MMSSSPRHGLATWTPEREARAVRLYLSEGFSAAEVAEALGGGLSRGAVIGKIRRLGYLKRPTRARSQPSRPCRRSGGEAKGRLERRLPPVRPPVPLPPLREVAATGTPATLASLGAGMCRWPVDDPGPGRMHEALFCAGPAGAHAYCPGHRRLSCGQRGRP